MRILVATDAWHPQVNGVVRTLTMMAEAAKAFGVDVSFLTPQSFRTFAMPSYPDLRLALPYPAKIAAADRRRRGPTAFTSQPKGRSDCWCGAIAANRDCRSPRAFTPAFRNTSPRACRSRILDLGGAALVPRRQPGGDGGDAGAGKRIARARLSQRGAVAARRRRQAIFIRAPSTLACRARSSCASAASRSKRISRRFSTSICPAPRWSSATGRRGRRWPENIRKPCFSARGRAKNWRRPMPPPTSSCFRARPTPLAWFCWRRSPAACRLAAFPVTGPRDVIGDGAGRRVERRFAGRVPVRADNFAASLPRVCRRAYLGSFGPRLRRKYHGRPQRRSGKRCGTIRGEAPAFRRLICHLQASCPPVGVRDTSRG